METYKAKLGEDHPDTLTSMSNLAYTWKSSGRDAEAIDLLQNCLAKRKQIIGLNHPDTLSTSETLLEWKRKRLSGRGWNRKHLNEREQEAPSNDHIRS